MMKNFRSLMSRVPLAGLCARLKADRRGNVLMIMGFAIIPLVFAVGFGIDYSRAKRLQTQLNAAADAAALAAVAPAMILKTNGEPQAAAESMFDAQAALQTGWENMHRTATIVDGSSGSGGSLGYLRKATVTYTVQSINIFGGILGARTLTVSGTSVASAEQPPNVDFYLAMDNSPSMLLPATSDGITKIQNVTNCAFACHEYMAHNEIPPYNPSSKIKAVTNANGLQVLLSASYYTSGASNQNVYYLFDSVKKLLYSSSGSAMNSSSTSVSGPTETTSQQTSGNSSNKVVTNTTTDTTVSTALATTYTLADSNSGPVTITVRTSSTPTTTVVKTTTTTTTTTTTKNGKTTTTVTTSQPSTTTNTTKGSTTTSPSSTYDTGYWADGYWLTHNYGLLYGSPSSIVLRKDDVVSAATQLIPFAANQASQYHVTYRAQMFSFDWTRSGSSSPVKTLNSLTSVGSYGTGFSVASLFPPDDYWWTNSKPTSSLDINDRASEITNMLTTMNGIIPTAGTGAANDTPQKILFIVTDGMLDQPNNGSGRYNGPLRTSDLANCTAIKAKGIKIAILYTQYLPEALSGDDWSQSNIAPFLPAPPSPYPTGNAGSSDQVLTALQSCASPGTNGSPLVQTVTANDNITTALQQLFSTALQSARLVQ